jgi:hypothetical protein
MAPLLAVCVLQEQLRVRRVRPLMLAKIALLARTRPLLVPRCAQIVRLGSFRQEPSRLLAFLVNKEHTRLWLDKHNV